MKLNLGLFNININIERNNKNFAKIDWMLYKVFKKRRIYPCGRTKKDKYLCCCLSPNEENSLIVDSGHSVICKVCGSTHIQSSKSMTTIPEKGWDF